MYSILRSDPNLTISQTDHCDQAVPCYYKRNNKFNFSTIVGVEIHIFLDIKPSKHESIERVLIKRGDISFVRNNIPHRRCENLIDYEHHCIHCFCKPLNIEDTRRGNLTVKADPFESTTYVDASANSLVSSFK